MHVFKLPALALFFIFITLNSAFALDVSGIRFGTHSDKQRVVVELSERAEFKAFTMSDPHRIVIDLPKFSFNAKNIKPPRHSLITDIRHGFLGNTNNKPISRLVFQTLSDVNIQSAFLVPNDKQNPNRIVIDFAKAEDKGQRTEDRKQKTESIAINTSSNRKQIIILDPGHGGQDSGAVSVHGTFEKNIVLAVGKELKRILEDGGRYTVRMTRDKDVFIPLGQRVKYARKQNGDLFMSLHADSIRSADVTGASVYTLSEKASDKEAEKLAERENKADIIAGVNLSNQEDDVMSILIDITSRETMNQSKFLANTVVTNLDNNGVDVLDRAPHRSAGFAVLKALDIPSVLVEMGYLTNETEAKKLNSPEHHKKIARALKASIDDYFKRVAAQQGQ
jgi:N-acetylmuramoyl-L-alanine amidase